MNNKEDEKIYAFIDSQNLNLAVKDIGWKLDYKKFRVYLTDKYKIDKAFIFIGYIKEYKTLYKSLESFGYKLVFKPTVKDNLGKPKGNIDAELVLHCAAIEYPNYDKAIIVSGDGDFHCLIEYLIKNNKLDLVIVPNFYRFSALLRKFMKNLVFLNKLKNKLSYQKERH